MSFTDYTNSKMFTYGSYGIAGVTLWFTLWLFPINLILVHLLTRAYMKKDDNFLESLKDETISFTMECIVLSKKCFNMVKEYTSNDSKNTVNKEDTVNTQDEVKTDGDETREEVAKSNVEETNNVDESENGETNQVVESEDGETNQVVGSEEEVDNLQQDELSQDSEEKRSE